MRTDTNPWRSLLYERLVDKPLPLIVEQDIITPGASIWLGARLWYKAFRAHDLKKGDRIILALPPSAPFLQILTAALWEQLSIAIVPPGPVAEETRRYLDAKVIFSTQSAAYAWTPNGLAGPSHQKPRFAKTKYGTSDEVRFLLSTSGTSGHPKWVALSDENILNVLNSHIPRMDLERARVLSVLPWFHVFGLTLDLLASLLSGAEIHRDDLGGKNTVHLLALYKKWQPTHLNTVPLVVSRLSHHIEGISMLNCLKGGIIGGAPVSAPLASILENTRLRVGYGQTEASPGITLGEPGVWQANYLGKPLGCKTYIGEDGELLFEGANACLGFWNEGLVEMKKDRRVATGDLVEEKQLGLFYRGRKDDAFKMDNGRFIYAGYWEATIKEAFPDVDDVLLFRKEANSLILAVTSLSQEAIPTLEQLQHNLGSLGNLLHQVVYVDPQSWVSTRKGTANRPLIVENLLNAAA